VEGVLSLKDLIRFVSSVATKFEYNKENDVEDSH
jgi:hypothetical protein